MADVSPESFIHGMLPKIVINKTILETTGISDSPRKGRIHPHIDANQSYQVHAQTGEILPAGFDVNNLSWTSETGETPDDLSVFVEDIYLQPADNADAAAMKITLDMSINIPSTMIKNISLLMTDDAAAATDTIKVKLVCIHNRGLANVLAGKGYGAPFWNGETYATDQEMSSYDGLVQFLQTSPNAPSEPVQIDYLKDIIDSSINSTSYKIDSSGNQIIEINFSKTFTLTQLNPRDIVIFAMTSFDFSTLDLAMEGLTTDNLGYDIDPQTSGIQTFEDDFALQNMSMTVINVIEKFKLKATVRRFYTMDNPPKIWAGPVHYHHPNPTWAGGQGSLPPGPGGYIGFMSGPKSNMGQKLTVKYVPNTKIQDFRNIQEVEKISIDLSPLRKNLSFDFRNLTNNGLNFELNSAAYFSKFYTIKDLGGDVRFFFSINIADLAKQETRFGHLYSNLKDLTNTVFIRSLKLYRERIKPLSPQRPRKANRWSPGKPRRPNPPPGYSFEPEPYEESLVPDHAFTFGATSNHSDFDVYDGGVLLLNAHDSFDDPFPKLVLGTGWWGAGMDQTSLRDDYRKIPIGLISEIDDLFLENMQVANPGDQDNKIRFFSGADLDFRDLSSGLYRYRIEIEFEDKSHLFFKNMVEDLSANLSAYKEIYREAIIPVVTGWTSFGHPERRALGGNYDSRTGRFTNEFIDSQPTYTDEASIYLKLVLSVKDALDKLLSEKGEKYETMLSQLPILCHPATGTPRSMLAIINFVDKLLSKIRRVSGLEEGKEIKAEFLDSGGYVDPIHSSVAQPSPAKSSGGAKTFKVAHTFNNDEGIVQSNEANNLCYEFFFDKLPDDVQTGLPADQGNKHMLKVLPFSDFLTRKDQEILKYYANVNADSLLVGEEELISDVGIDATAYTYFTPKSIEVNGELVKMEIGDMELINKPFPPGGSFSSINPHSFSLFAVDQIVSKIRGDFLQFSYPPDAETDSAVQYKLKSNLAHIFSNMSCTVRSLDTGLQSIIGQVLTLGLEEDDARHQDAIFALSAASVFGGSTRDTFVELLGSETASDVLGHKKNIYTNANSLLMHLLTPVLLGKSKIVNNRIETGKFNTITARDLTAAYNLFATGGEFDTDLLGANMPDQDKKTLLISLPHQIKAFILALGSQIGVGFPQSDLDSTIKKVDWTSMAAFAQISNNLKKIEVFTGYSIHSQETTSTSGAHYLMKQEIWKPLDRAILTSIADKLGGGNKNILCRIVPYTNSALGVLEDNASIDLPISNKYFFLNIPSQALSLLPDLPSLTGNIETASIHDVLWPSVGVVNDVHQHTYEIDEFGNGWTEYVTHFAEVETSSGMRTFTKYKHRHKIDGYVVTNVASADPELFYTEEEAINYHASTNWGGLFPPQDAVIDAETNMRKHSVLSGGDHYHGYNFSDQTKVNDYLDRLFLLGETMDETNEGDDQGTGTEAPPTETGGGTDTGGAGPGYGI